MDYVEALRLIRWLLQELGMKNSSLEKAKELFTMYQKHSKTKLGG